MCIQMWLTGSLFLLITLFSQPGYAGVKCYICSTQVNETECLYPKSYDLPVFKCDQTALDKTRELAKKIDPSYDKIFEVDTNAMARQVDLVCLKVVTKLGTKKYTFRGCQLAEQANTDICHKMNIADTDYLKKQHCSKCNTDRCNLAHRSLQNGVSVIISLIVSALFISL